MSVTDLPAVNATLNGIATVLLLTGYVLVRKKRFDQHRRVMLAAFGTSVLFLISYVIYHANAGSRSFQAQVRLDFPQRFLQLVAFALQLLEVDGHDFLRAGWK